MHNNSRRALGGLPHLIASYPTRFGQWGRGYQNRAYGPRAADLSMNHPGPNKIDANSSRRASITGFSEERWVRTPCHVAFEPRPQEYRKVSSRQCIVNMARMGMAVKEFQVSHKRYECLRRWSSATRDLVRTWNSSGGMVVAYTVLHLSELIAHVVTQHVAYLGNDRIKCARVPGRCIFYRHARSSLWPSSTSRRR